MRIGFIGLGLMGQGMALNLCRAGHDLVVHDLNRASGAALEAAGATWAASVAELADSAGVVFTSLPGPAEMQEVGVGDGGLLSALKPGSAWFDLTTNSPTVGTSGSAWARSAVVTASARSLPARMSATEDGIRSNITCTCPPSRSVSAGGEPR